MLSTKDRGNSHVAHEICDITITYANFNQISDETISFIASRRTHRLSDMCDYTIIVSDMITQYNTTPNKVAYTIKNRRT
jgi:hypothetical protein